MSASGGRPQAIADAQNDAIDPGRSWRDHHSTTVAGNSRLSTSAEAGAVVISESTRRLLDSFCVVAASLLLA